MRRGAALVLVAIAGLVVVNILAARSGRAWDLTAEGSATLSDETRRVLDRLDRRVEITAFFGRDDIGRVEAATLLSRYRKASRHISFRILDPALAPGEAERLGGVGSGSAAVADRTDPDRIEIAQFTIEIDLTSAIARLLRDASGTVCFTSGAGERAVEEQGSDGLSQAAQLLRDNGYTVRTIDLLSAPAVPEACDATVVVSPTERLGEPALAALRADLQGSGKALVVSDPESTVDLSPLTQPWGISFVRGVVIEGDPNSHLPDDITAPIVRRYEATNAAVRGAGPTFFPGVGGIEVKDPGRAGLSVTPVATTSELSYLDRRDVASFDPDVDRRGPVVVAAAADESAVRGARGPAPKVDRTRILAVADADFVSNAHVDQAGNARLFVQAVDWLTQPEPLLAAVPAFPALRDLELTQARSRYILLLTAAVVPGLFLVAGGFVWVLRRGR